LSAQAAEAAASDRAAARGVAQGRSAQEGEKARGGRIVAAGFFNSSSGKLYFGMRDESWEWPWAADMAIPSVRETVQAIQAGTLDRHPTDWARRLAVVDTGFYTRFGPFGCGATALGNPAGAGAASAC
jgi:hypothetical protein